MKRLIIADAHVGQGVNDSRAMTSLVERAAASGVGEIIYLGDGFQYLIGMSKFWTTGFREVLAAWRRARSAGVAIGIVEGNRDFFLDAPELATEIDWSARLYDFQSGDRRYRLVHGDLVNRRDLQNRFWSRISKASVARLWAHLLPRAAAVAIVRRMEAHLAMTNRKFRYAKPLADLEKSAYRAWAEGIGTLFWGHFHTPWMCRDGDHEALIIPAWLESRTSVLVDAGGGWSLVDDDFERTSLVLDDDAVGEPRPGGGGSP
ncbi:MAG: metallophosphoesterase family protein [Acidobacteriota bacterium]|nr:metallophosphoesterase family protein [Acidobacteriota bacterium]